MRTPTHRHTGLLETDWVGKNLSNFLDATTAVAHQECSMTITPLVDEGAGLMHGNRRSKRLLEETTISYKL